MEKSGNKLKKIKIILSVIVVLVSVIAVAFSVYVGDYYHASENAVSLISDKTEENYTIEQCGKNIVFKPGEVTTIGLIFYPGGKVEHTAYVPLMAEFAKNGILCLLCEMPFNLAVFKTNAADGITENHKDITRWYIGGHSLGGAMAASYAAKNESKFEGLLLLGAYSTEKISTDMNVISLYGSEDKVLNMQKYNDNKKNLPENFNEKIISGGCHSFFGDYGLQKGDGTPTISRESQISETVKYFKEKTVM